MIQRIQSLYLAISIICLTIVTFGMTIYRLEDSKSFAHFSVYGREVFSQTGKLEKIESFPFYIIPILLILMCFFTLFSYKKINKQLRTGRITIFLYLVCIFLVMFYPYLAKPLDSVEQHVSLGLGFFLFVCGFPFVFLANIGIKRDKNLLDSLNRLR